MEMFVSARQGTDRSPGEAHNWLAWPKGLRILSSKIGNENS